MEKFIRNGYILNNVIFFNFSAEPVVKSRKKADKRKNNDENHEQPKRKLRERIVIDYSLPGANLEGEPLWTGIEV